MESNGFISISAAQASAHGLPPVAIQFDCSKTGLIGFMFPEPRMFLRMSGPPGGPCRVEIEWIPASSEAHSDPVALARRLDVPKNKFLLGSSGRIEAAGANRAAVSWRIQPTPWVEQLTGMLIAVPKHRGALWVVLPGEGDFSAAPRVSQHYWKIVRTLDVRP